MCLFRGRLKNEKLRLDCAGASGSRLGPSRKAGKNTEKPVCEPTHLQTLFSPQKYLKNFNPWEQKSHGPISFPAQSPQTPLFNKLTLSTCNSNHSGECFLPSCSGPLRVHPVALMGLQGGPEVPEWHPRVLPRCQNGCPE